MDDDAVKPADDAEPTEEPVKKPETGDGEEKPDNSSESDAPDESAEPETFKLKPRKAKHAKESDEEP
ncbi:MAG TPA: hypothetical protein VGF17_21120, partial [Phytomonospora sp.]